MENSMSKEAKGSMHTAQVHASVFCTDPGALDPSSAFGIGTRQAEAVMKSNSCKRRNDIAGQSIDIERHVCLADTSVQILQKHNAFMAETGHEHASFSDRTIFASMFHDITNCTSRKVQNDCLAQSERSGYSRSKIQSRLLVFLWFRIRNDTEKK